MARIKKFAEVLPQPLTSFQTFLVDTNPNSTYFRITEFRDTFTGGKNGFLIEGSEHLKESTEIKLQILDVNGDPIYYEPGNGIPEYYEGVSKLVAVYVYEDTPIGEAKITVLGELKTYLDEGNVVRPVPEDWQGVYNVKWEKTFKVNKLLSNEDKVRFYRRPEVTITEIVKPIFSNIVREVTQTGFVNGIPQVPAEGQSLTGYTLPTSYLLTTLNDSFWTGSVTNNYITLTNKGVSLLADDVVSDRDLTVSTPYNENGIVKPLIAEPYSVTFNYIEGNDNLKTALTGSFAKINVTDLTTFVGDCARVKIFRRSQSDLSDYQFVQEIQLESNELLRDLESSTKNEEYYGSFDQFNYKNYWLTSSNNITTQFNQNYLFNSVKLDTNSIGQRFFTSKSLEITPTKEYTLNFNLRLGEKLTADKYIKAYLSGSTIINAQEVGKTQSLVTITAEDVLLQKKNINVNFKADDITNPQLNFEINSNNWYISDVSLRASQETSFSPDEITFIQPIPRTLPRETFDFRFQFYDINNNYIPVLVEETKTFDGGNLNVINKDLQLIPSSLYFQFDSGSGTGNPVPPTTIFIDVIKNYLTGSVNFTSRSFDFANNELFNTDYVGIGAQYPGLLLDRETDTARLTVENFTGSRADKLVQYIEFTGECEGVTDSIIITRVLDGKGGVNHFIRPYRGTQIRNSSTQSLEIQAVRVDGINEINLYSGAQNNWGNIQLHVLSASLNPATEPEKFINLALASSSRFVRGISTGSLGSREINYNPLFNRDSIDFRRIIYLMPSSSAAASPAYAVSGSVLASLVLEDLQDGLDTPSIISNVDTFAINPRIEKNFRPSFGFGTASFYERGSGNAITSSFRVFPSMSINKDYIPEYWFYYTTQSTDKTISVIARDENRNIIQSLPLNSYIASSNQQSKNLTITFTYTEPFTSASISVDRTFTIVPEGRPGDESIVFEVTPAIVNLNANAKGIVGSYSSSVTEIRLKQGSRYLNFTASKGEGTFFIVSGSITGSNIIPGNIRNPLPPGFNKDWTGSLFIGSARDMNNLSGSVVYNVEIQPYYTSSIYTASIVQQFNKILDGAPQLEVILNPDAVVLNADENGTVKSYALANSTLRVKEGSDYLIYNTSSNAPGTFLVGSFTQTNIFTASLTSSVNSDTALVRFHNFNSQLTGSVTYNIIAFPYSLGAGHQYTSSVLTKVQTFSKLLDGTAARKVSLSATSNFVNFDADGVVVSPAGDIELTAVTNNFTGSPFFQFFKDGFAYTPIQASNQTTIASGDSVAPGETALWSVQVRDGSSALSSPVVGQDSLTITGIQQGLRAYNANLTNDNVSVVYRVSGELELGNTGTTITATKGLESLTHVAVFSPQTLDIFSNEIGSLGEYQVTIHSKSAHLTLAGNLASQSIIPTVGGVAQIGSLVGWTNADSNPIGSVVYRIDFENNKGVAFKTQSFSVQFEGNTGPGIIMRGQYTELYDYIGSYETTNFRRDAVIWPDPSGSSGQTHYFAALSGSGPNTYVNPTTSQYYVGNTPPGGFVLIGKQYPPAVGNDNAYWQYLGEQDFFVAAKIAIFDESFVKNTINVGNNPGSSFANIVLAGGRTDPYMAIGQVGTSGASGVQSGTGVIGYDRPGIFLGMYENAVPNGTSGRFSISNADGSKALKWDGSNLTIVGSIKQSSPGVNEGRLMGAWAASTQYYANDIVTYGGNTWTANTNHVSTNNTNALTGYPGFGPWTIAPIASSTLVLAATSQVFIEAKDGSVFPNYIQIDANKQNISSTTNWTTSPSVTLYDSSTGGSVTTTGNTVYLRKADFGTNTLVEVTATAGAYSDKTTIARVKEGSDAITIILTNEAHTLPANNAGVVSDYNGSGTQILLYEGATLLDYDGSGTSNGTWTVSTSTSNITAGTISSTGTTPLRYVTVGNHSNATADQSSVTYTITGKKKNGDAISFTKVQSLTKSKQGAAGANGAAGAGVVYRGNWVGTNLYFHTSTRRDVVRGSNGTYYLANNTGKSGLATWGDPTGSADWTTFGAEFSSVATDILFSQDVYANRTVNVGEGLVPLISLNADAPNNGNNPFISIGQLSRTGSSGYDQDGIFLGMFSGSARMSLKSNQGVMRWTGNTLEVQGTVRATDGQLGAGNNVWKIDNALLYSSASVGQIQLNANRPSIEIYDSGSNLRVDINSNSNLSPLSAFQPPISASATPNIAQAYYPAEVIVGGDIGESSTAIVQIYGQNVSSSASPSSASFYAPTSAEGLGAIITVNVDGNFWGSGFMGGSGTIRYGEVSQAYGVRVFFVPQNYTGPEETVAEYLFYGGNSQFYSPWAGPYDATLVGDMTRTITIPLTLKGGGFYRIQTLARDYYCEFGGIGDRDVIPPPLVTIDAVNHDPYGVGSPPGVNKYGPVSPRLVSVSINISTSKTEIIAGGMQVAFSTDRYVRIPRTADGAMMKIGGGLELVCDQTTGITSTSGSVNIFNEVFSPDFTNGKANTGGTAVVTSGYSKLVNGMIVQAGYITTGGTGPANAAINFPLAFPTKCLAVTCATDRNSSGANGYNHVTGVSTTGATLVFDAAGDGYWIAVGY